MPRVQDAIPCLDCRAWKGRSNPLLLTALRFAPESRQRVHGQEPDMRRKRRTNGRLFTHQIAAIALGARHRLSASNDRTPSGDAPTPKRSARMRVKAEPV